MIDADRHSLRNTVVLIAGLLVFWQLMYFLVGDVAMRSPWQTIRVTAKLAQTDWFWEDVDNTMRAFAAALAIAVALGLFMGFALGLHRLSAEAMEPMLVALKPTADGGLRTAGDGHEGRHHLGLGEKDRRRHPPHELLPEERADVVADPLSRELLAPLVPLRLHVRLQPALGTVCQPGP